MGRFVTAREAYPADSEWGQFAISRPNSDDLDYLKERPRAAVQSGNFAAFGKPKKTPPMARCRDNFFEHGASGALQPIKTASGSQMMRKQDDWHAKCFQSRHQTGQYANAMPSRNRFRCPAVSRQRTDRLKPGRSSREPFAGP